MQNGYSRICIEGINAVFVRINAIIKNIALQTHKLTLSYRKSSDCTYHFRFNRFSLRNDQFKSRRMQKRKRAMSHGRQWAHCYRGWIWHRWKNEWGKNAYAIIALLTICFLNIKFVSRRTIWLLITLPLLWINCTPKQQPLPLKWVKPFQMTVTNSSGTYWCQNHCHL